jgi:glyoxylase-like metal-dependent hydrolase (beta-lactamase superfamily II)
MPLEIARLQLGPMENNTYLLADTDAAQAVVIDPSFDSEFVLETVKRQGWSLSAIWLTHAHFDHIAGVETIQAAFPNPLPVGLHPQDLPLWREGGGARLFGMQVEPGADPSIEFEHGQVLEIGQEKVEVRHTPGHTPGHVIFYASQAGAAIVGDLVFYHGIGRTDMPGGSQDMLINSIRSQILTLPQRTRILSGHGQETSIEEEMRGNPFF